MLRDLPGSSLQNVRLQERDLILLSAPTNEASVWGPAWASRGPLGGEAGVAVPAALRAL